MIDSEFKQRLQLGALIASVLIPLLTGIFSAYLTAADMELYNTMQHPKLAPPAWVFPIAWTVLYVLMGLAAYLIYVSDAAPEDRRIALSLFVAQLVLNFFWSTLFFTYRRYLIALIWLLAMWVLVLLCVIRFFRIKRAAGLMMTVLLLWLSFAAYLNFSSYLIDRASR